MGHHLPRQRLAPIELKACLTSHTGHANCFFPNSFACEVINDCMECAESEAATDDECEEWENPMGSTGPEGTPMPNEIVPASSSLQKTPNRATGCTCIPWGF